MNALIGASGVGSETWKRTCGGITPSRLSLAKMRVRRDRRVGEAEVVEHDVRGALAVAQPQLGQRAVRVRAGRSDLELRQGAEHRVLPEDPVRPRAGLAVGQPAQAVAERLGGTPKDLLDASQRHAADEMRAHRGGRRQRVGGGGLRVVRVVAVAIVDCSVIVAHHLSLRVRLPPGFVSLSLSDRPGDDMPGPERQQRAGRGESPALWGSHACHRIPVLIENRR